MTNEQITTMKNLQIMQDLTVPDDQDYRWDAVNILMDMVDDINEEKYQLEMKLGLV